MMPALEMFFRWIWEVSWQASLLALAVWIVQRVSQRGLNPRWRHALWLLVLLRLVLPIVPESPVSGNAFIPMAMTSAGPLSAPHEAPDLTNSPIPSPSSPVAIAPV